MAAKGGGKEVGRAKVVVEFVPDEESLASIAQSVQNATGKDASPSTERSRRGQVGGGVARTVEVDAKVKAKVEKNLSKDVQTELDKTDYQLTIDTGNIRQQIQNALKAPFDIVVNAEIRGATLHALEGGGDTAHGAAVTHGAPVGRTPAPQEITKLLTTGMRDAINAVYRNINEASQAAGKGRFGHQGIDPGNEVEKAVELIGRFGDKFSDMLQVKGPVNKPVGGSLSPQELGKALGLDPKHPSLQALPANLLGLTSNSGSGASPSRAIDTFFTRLKKWSDETPLTAAPAAAAEVKPRYESREESRAAITKTEEQARAVREAVIDERQRSLVRTPLGVGAFAGSPALQRTQTERGDVATDATARRALGGGERANVRRLRSRGTPVAFGNQSVDLEDYLRAAEAGMFTGVFEQFGGKGNRESQGLTRLEATSAEGFDELTRLGKRKPGVKFGIAGQEGRFAAVSPSEAIIRQIIKDLGIEEDVASAEQVRAQLGPDTRQGERLRQATAQGSSPRRAVSGATKRGQGSPSMLGGGDAAKRLQLFDEWIEYAETRSFELSERLVRINTALERASKHRDTGKVRELEQASREVAKQLQAMDAGIADAITDRRELAEAASPAEAKRLTKSQISRANAAARARVAAGVGFTDNEKLDRQLSSPEAQGRYGKQIMGALGDDPSGFIRSALLQRYMSEEGRPEGRTGRYTMRQAAFGPSGRARRSPGSDEGILGEVMAGAPDDLGKDATRTLRQSVIDILDSTLKDEGFKRDIAEADILKKEGLTRGVGRARDVASAVVTDEGIQRASFRAPVTGEGEFIGLAPGIAGRGRASLGRNAQIEAGYEPPAGTEYPYEPGVGERLAASEQRSERLKGEAEKAAATRQRTLGRGRYQSGAETEAIARASGMTMEQEQANPWAAMLAKYGGGGDEGGAGAGGGGGGGFGGLTPGGVVPVRVVNWPTGFGRGGGGGGGRKPPAPDVYSFSPDEEPDAQPRAAGGSRTPSAIERAMEQDFITQLRKANTPKRRKNIGRLGNIGTEIDPGRIYSFSPDEPQGRRPSYTGSSLRESGAEENDFFAALRGANDPNFAEKEQRRAEARQRRLARTVRAADPVGFASQIDAEDEAQREIRGRLRSLNRKIPRRGFGASLTDLVTSIVPGSGSLERQLEAGDLATREAEEIRSAGSRRAQARTVARNLGQQIIGERQAGRGGGDLERELVTQRRDQIRVIGQQNKIIDESSKRFTRFADEASKGTTVLKSFSAAAAGGAVSAAAGSVQFALASVITAPLLQGVGEVISASLEKVLGQPTAIGQTRLNLGEQIRAAQGNASVGFGAVAGAAGLSGENQDRLGGLLGQTGAIEAGNKALADQINIFRLAQDQQKRGGGAAGTTQTLNGILGTPIGGTAPAAELLADFLKEGIPGQPVSGFRGAPGRGLSIGGKATEVPLTAEQLTLLSQKLELVNGQLDKNGESLINFENATKFSRDEVDAQAKALKNAGQNQLGNLVAGGRVAITNQQGGLATADEVARGLTTALEQQAKPTAEALLRQQRPQTQAQIAFEDMQRQFQLNTVNPQTFAIQEAQRPLAPANTGFVPADQKRYNAELTQTQKLYDQINADVQTGLDASKQFVSQTLGAGAGADFAAALGKSVEYGKQISQIEIGVQTKQAAYSAAQFSYQLSIARRSLADAKGLVSGIGDSMGAIERQIFNLQRQSQSLSLGQSQRQINFQRAVAGFQAPGVTSEERQARIDQAKTEADFAQKQLNIQKQLFGLQGRQFSRGAARQVRDLNRQIDLLQQGRDVQISTAVAEKKIQALTKLQAKENKQVETFYAAAVQRTGDVQQKIAELVAATGEGLQKVGKLVLKEFSNGYDGFIAALGAGGNPSSNPASDSYSGAAGGHALGFLGTVNGATSLGKFGVAGEAGGEAVAIVRDAQKLISPMGGGGGDNFTFSVVINNPVVKNDDDKRKLIADVKRAIQEEARQFLPRR